MGFTLTVVTQTDVGRVRKRNEDAVASSPEHGIVVVADGMGGHPSGNVASQIASAEALDVLLTWDSSAQKVGGEDEEEHSAMGQRMSKAVTMADRRVREAGEQDPEMEGMGTTITALLADVNTGHWAIGHVGDSRAYLLRDGELRQVTRDDSWVQEQVEAGLMSQDDARHHPWSSVLSQALGLERPASPSVYEGTLQEGDIFLLCSDGLSGLVEDRELEGVLADREGDELEEAANLLVEAACNRGGPDNITIGIVRVDRDQPAERRTEAPTRRILKPPAE